MARPVQKKARKDYPDQGIEKGDLYYFVAIKRQRGGIIKRSLKPFKPSQLTESPFKSGFLAAGEAWDESNKDSDAMREAAEAIRELGTEAQCGFDNMPEGLQQGDTGQMIEARANHCEETASGLDDLADEYEALDEPDEVDEPDDDEAPDFLAKTDAWETYQEELSHYESEQSRVADEADNLVHDMPE